MSSRTRLCLALLCSGHFRNSHLDDQAFLHTLVPF